MEEEARKSIPPVLAFLSNDDILVIDNLSDLESTGICASYGYLESIRNLILQNFDVTLVPSNILNSLTIVISGLLTIKEVDGLELSMLGNLNCNKLLLESFSIPASALVTTQEIHVSDCILDKIIGNLC